MRIRDVEKVVHAVLLKDKQARVNDFCLWFATVNEMYPDNKLNEYSFGAVMCNAKTLCLPPFESVTRIRRKLQAKYPELCDNAVKQARTEKEEEFREYARTN